MGEVLAYPRPAGQRLADVGRGSRHLGAVGQAPVNGPHQRSGLVAAWDHQVADRSGARAREVARQEEFHRGGQAARRRGTAPGVHHELRGDASLVVRPADLEAGDDISEVVMAWRLVLGGDRANSISNYGKSFFTCGQEPQLVVAVGHRGPAGVRRLLP